MWKRSGGPPDCIDAHLRKLNRSDQHTGYAASTRWLREALPAIADELQSLLDVIGIVVEPTPRHRPRRTYAP
jgi:hypothetical protein